MSGIKKIILLLLPLFFLLSSCSKDLAEVQYYKNLPEISGTTNDENPLFFILEVELAYTWGDKKTQYSLAELKPVLIDALRNLFCSKYADDFSSVNESLLKEEVVELVNYHLHRYEKFKNVPGIVGVAFVKVQVFEFR
jgi:flagellar basal body-associated protein FliL